jgi:hypothetical protein
MSLLDLVAAKQPEPAQRLDGATGNAIAVLTPPKEIAAAKIRINCFTIYS